MDICYIKCSLTHTHTHTTHAVHPEQLCRIAAVSVPPKYYTAASKMRSNAPNTSVQCSELSEMGDERKTIIKHNNYIKQAASANGLPKVQPAQRRLLRQTANIRFRWTFGFHPLSTDCLSSNFWEVIPKRRIDLLIAKMCVGVGRKKGSHEGSLDGARGNKQTNTSGDLLSVIKQNANDYYARTGSVTRKW